MEQLHVKHAGRPVHSLRNGLKNVLQELAVQPLRSLQDVCRTQRFLPRAVRKLVSFGQLPFEALRRGKRGDKRGNILADKNVFSCWPTEFTWPQFLSLASDHRNQVSHTAELLEDFRKATATASDAVKSLTASPCQVSKLIQQMQKTANGETVDLLNLHVNHLEHCQWQPP